MTQTADDLSGKQCTESEPPVANVRTPISVYVCNVVSSTILARLGPAPLTTPPGAFAIDTHVHSEFSKCSCSRIEAILLRCHRMGLKGVAVTDHNSLLGGEAALWHADRLKEQSRLPNDFLVLPGVEIATSAGHVGALFLNERVPRKLRVDETVEWIHHLGGIAIAVHPYSGSGVGDAIFDSPFDAVEIDSGSALSPRAVTRGHALLSDERLAGIARLGSSDAHYTRAIGMCCTLFHTDDASPEGVRRAIEEGQTSPYASDAVERLRRLMQWLKRRKAHRS